MQTPTRPVDARREQVAARVEHAEVVRDASSERAATSESEAVEQPAKVMRIGSMIKQLLEEVRQADAARRAEPRPPAGDLRDLGAPSCRRALSPDLRDELARLALPVRRHDARPSDAELRIAQAQLVGWLEGLFHGIQATLFAQQMAARQQLEEMRRRLPPGSSPMGAETETRPGTYL